MPSSERKYREKKRSEQQEKRNLEQHSQEDNATMEVDEEGQLIRDLENTILRELSRFSSNSINEGRIRQTLPKKYSGLTDSQIIEVIRKMLKDEQIIRHKENNHIFLSLPHAQTSSTVFATTENHPIIFTATHTPVSKSAKSDNEKVLDLLRTEDGREWLLKYGRFHFLSHCALFDHLFCQRERGEALTQSNPWRITLTPTPNYDPITKIGNLLEKEEYRANLARVGRERSYYACYINLWGHLIDQLHSGQPLTEFPVGGSKPDVFTDDLAKIKALLQTHVGREWLSEHGLSHFSCHKDLFEHLILQKQNKQPLTEFPHLC